MTTIKLRTAERSDAKSIQVCIASAYADAMRDIADLPDVTSGIEEEIAEHQVVIAEVDGTLLGVIIFDQQAEAMMIFNLAVSPEAQGKGVARQLLAVAEAEAVELGLSILRLRTHRLMHATREMYTHLGWVEVEGAGNSVVMQKWAK